MAGPESSGDPRSQRFGLRRAPALKLLPPLSRRSRAGRPGAAMGRRSPRSPRPSRAAMAAPASRAGMRSKSPRRASFTAGVRRAATGVEGQQEDRATPSSCTCGAPRTLVIPAGLPLSSLVAKFPQRADDLWLDQAHLLEQVGPAGFDLDGCGSRLPGGLDLRTLAMKTSSRAIPMPLSTARSAVGRRGRRREGPGDPLRLPAPRRRTSGRHRRHRPRRPLWCGSREGGTSCTPGPLCRARRARRGAPRPRDSSQPPSPRLGGGTSPAARLRFVSASRSPRAASLSRRLDSPAFTRAPRGWRPGGETGESRRRARLDPQTGQAGSPAPAETSSSKRAAHSSHSNSYRSASAPFIIRHDGRDPEGHGPDESEPRHRRSPPRTAGASVFRAKAALRAALAAGRAKG